MAKEPLFLGRATHLGLEANPDGAFVQLRLEFREGTDRRPVEFVLSAPMCMHLMRTLQGLQKKHNWPTGH